MDYASEPVRSPRNTKILRFVVAGIVLLFLIQFVLYSLDSRRKPLHATEETVEINE